jgi:hypothetical protein
MQSLRENSLSVIFGLSKCNSACHYPDIGVSIEVVRETTEWLTRHNTRYHLGHGKDSVWIERQSQSLLYNLLKRTILSLTSTEKTKFEVGTPEQCLFMGRDNTGKVVTHIVGTYTKILESER